MSRRRALRAVALASLCCVAACGDGDRAERRAAAVNDGARSSPASDLPDALLLRFRESNGVGFDRESWELELLQMGSDIRLRGSVRSGGTSVAIYQPMGPGDFAHLWQWIRTLPYPGWQAHEDESVAEAEWSKSLQIDVVLRNGDRKLGRGTWRRPLVGAAWVQDLEDRMHALALDLARQEMARQQSEKDAKVRAGDEPSAAAGPSDPGEDPLAP